MKTAVPTSSVVRDNDLFTIDLKGDRHNLTYGATHRYAVPRFHRAGSGRVLGADERYFIDREHHDTDSLVLRMKGHGTSGDARAKQSRPLSRKYKQSTQLYRLRAQDYSSSPLEHEKDFLHFDPGYGLNGDQMDGFNSDDERRTYRSIHGKAKEEDDIPAGTEPLPNEGSLEQDIQVDFDADRKARNAELSRAIDSHPADIGSWLRLIDHQDNMILRPGEEARLLTHAERLGVGEVKLSLYDKALRKIGDDSFKDRLLLGRLHEGAQIWDSRKLLDEWEGTLKKHPGFISLWIKYLDFRQTDSQGFAFQHCMANFLNCLNLNASTATGPFRLQVQCYLLLRLTLFIREAGYLELAVGLWQAVLEFTCFQPSSLIEKDDLQAALSSFAAFWESEAARIGEKGATGWRNGPSTDVDHVTHSFRDEIDFSHPFLAWSRAERRRDIVCRTPSRSVDEFESGLDPYSVVLFSDLKDILPLFWGLHSSDELIDSFLYFCHLPHLTVNQNVFTTRMWSGDNFLRNELMDNTHTNLTHWMPTNTENSQASVSPFRFVQPNFLHTTETLIALPENWFTSFQLWKLNTQSEESSIDPEWVRRVLRSLVEIHPADDELAEYVLALEFTCDHDAAKKYSKQLLKTRSSNLRLYNSFALMQWHSGHESAASHVWSTALSMSKDFEDFNRIDCGLLWASWLWVSFSSGDVAQATNVLNAMTATEIDLTAFSAKDPVQIGATSLLRLQNSLRESQERALAYRKSQVYTGYTDCSALLAYLTENSLEAALEVYASAVAKLRDLRTDEENTKVFIAELLHQSRARLVYLHVERKAKFQPRRIHEILKESISLFPHNTIFLSLFMWNESRFPIFDRVRDVRALINSTDPDNRYCLGGNYGLPAASPQNTPISTHIFSIYSELCRPVFTGSTVHSVRAAFEKAIGENTTLAYRPGDKDTRHTFDMDSARSNLSIWKLYILFELQRNHDVDAAKAVLYRAIRACPWSKELIMLAFEHFRDDLIPETHQRQPRRKKQAKHTGLGFDELRQLYNALIEKQLRVHVDISNEIADIARQRSLVSEEADEAPRSMNFERS